MRAREFIKESKPAGKMPEDFESVHQGSIRMRDVGGYDRFYHMNRLGMALALADGKNKKPVDGVDSASWVEKYNVAFPYTDMEHLMMMQAMATIPTDGKELSKRAKSEEPTDTGTTSPVASWNKKK